MNSFSFRAFVKEAIALQVEDAETPSEYVPVRAAITRKFGLGKEANAAAELAGLGMLAVPSIQGLRGKHMDDRTKDKLEVAGLGTLAAPYAVEIGKKALKKFRR